MIFTLVLMYVAQQGSGEAVGRPSWLNRIAAKLSGSAPEALGRSFGSE
jgi:hypothetical protein